MREREKAFWDIDYAIKYKRNIIKRRLFGLLKRVRRSKANLYKVKF